MSQFMVELVSLNKLLMCWTVTERFATAIFDSGMRDITVQGLNLKVNGIGLYVSVDRI